MAPLTALAVLGGLVMATVTVRTAAAEDQDAAPPFLLVEETISNDAARRVTSFELIFNQAPDFFTVDEFGRQRHAFQYYIDTKAAPPPVPELPSPGLDLVIRGGEIARTGELVLRLAGGGDGEQGWGRVLAQVPFVLHGNGLGFTVPWSALGETDGRFSYGLLLLDQGAATDHRSGMVETGPAGPP